MIQGLVQGAASAVNQAVNQAAGAVRDLASQPEKLVTRGPADHFKDSFDLKGLFSKGKEIFTGAKEFFSQNNSVGKIVGHGLDKIGLPDWASSFAGGAVDMMMMNPRGYEQIMMGVSHAAGEMGLDGFSSFMATASDVTSMATTVGKKVALTAVTGGAGAPGLLASLGHLGKFGQAAATVGKAAQHVQTAMNVVDGLKSGNLGSLGGILSSFGGNAGIIGEALEKFGGGQIGDLLGGVFGDGGDLLGKLFQNLDLSEILGNTLPDLADILSINTGDIQGLAGPILDVGKQLASMVGQGSDLPGTQLFRSEAGEALVQALGAFINQEIGATLGASEIAVNAVIDEAAAMTEGMMNVAGLSSDVAREIMEILLQLGSINQSSAVSDLVGTQLRC